MGRPTQTLRAFKPSGAIAQQLSFDPYTGAVTATAAQTRAGVISSCNALCDTTTIGHPDAFAHGWKLPASRYGPNGVATTVNATYDALARPAALFKAGLSTSGPGSVVYEYQTSSKTVPWALRTWTLATVAGGVLGWNQTAGIIDGLGRARHNQTLTGAANRSVSSTFYNNRGLVATQTGSDSIGSGFGPWGAPLTLDPQAATATPRTDYSYDELDRAVTATAVGTNGVGLVTTTIYNGLTTTVTPASASGAAVTTIQNNVRRETIKITEPQNSGPDATTLFAVSRPFHHCERTVYKRRGPDSAAISSLVGAGRAGVAG